VRNEVSTAAKNALHHDNTTTHCMTLKHTATHTATHCHSLHTTTLCNAIGKELDGVRNEVSTAAKNALHYDNKVLVMALCKSKGSNDNISQMIGCLGQQKLGIYVIYL